MKEQTNQELFHNSVEKEYFKAEMKRYNKERDILLQIITPKQYLEFLSILRTGQSNKIECNHCDKLFHRSELVFNDFLHQYECKNCYSGYGA